MIDKRLWTLGVMVLALAGQIDVQAQTPLRSNDCRLPIQPPDPLQLQIRVSGWRQPTQLYLIQGQNMFHQKWEWLPNKGVTGQPHSSPPVLIAKSEVQHLYGLARTSICQLQFPAQGDTIEFTPHTTLVAIRIRIAMRAIEVEYPIEKAPREVDKILKSVAVLVKNSTLIK